MGIHDREYYRDEDAPYGLRLGGSRMLVTNLVIINLAIFAVDAFTSPVSFETANGVVRLDDIPPESRRNLPIESMRIHSRWLDDVMSLDADIIRKPWKCWQLITYGFAHAPIGSRANIWHVGMNMLVLWMFGREIEMKYGRGEFLRFYLLAIVFAAVVWLAVRYLTVLVMSGGNLAALTRGPLGGGMLGASGAVTAVFLLFVFNYPKRTVYIWGILAVPAWVVGAIFVGIDLMGALSGGGHVAYEAHLAGAAFGSAYYLLGLNFSRLLPGGRFVSLRQWIKPRPKLKVHDPEDVDDNLDDEADRVLDKLHRLGESSLNAKERRILEAYSRRMRQKLR